MHILLEQETGENSQICYNARRLRRFSPLTPSVVSITETFTPQRKRVEAFIASVYSTNYGARIGQHYPTLMSIRDGGDSILGALGFRKAARDRLFLEYYLDAPVEVEMSRVLGTAIDREGIIEIGNLASEGAGAAIFLIPALMAYLKQQGYRHVAFTATAGLYDYFSTIGVNPVIIAPADQKRLPDGGASWGSYYDSAPHVIAGDVRFAADRLQRFLGVRLLGAGAEVFPRLHHETGIDRAVS